MCTFCVIDDERMGGAPKSRHLGRDAHAARIIRPQR